MRRLLLLPLVVAAVAASLAALAHARGGDVGGFRLADASVACRYEADGVVCRSLGVRAGLALPAAGVPEPVDAPIWWDASTPVLDEATRGEIACRAAGPRIVCTNASGATISVGAEQIAVAL